jgi:hypothetical protein
MFKTKESRKETRIKPHNTLALPALFYGGENWTIKERGAIRIRAGKGEMHENNSRIHLERL